MLSDVGSPITSIYYPPMPQWLRDLRDRQRDWIDTHCGLSDAMKGCSEQFNSASHLMQKDINKLKKLRQLYNDLFKPKLMWDKTYIDELMPIIPPPMPKWIYNEIHKHWYKSVPIKKENKIMKFFKAIKRQTQKLETVVSALKWFGLIKWDKWDEKYYTIKPNGISEQDISMRLCSITGFAHNAKLKLDDLKIITDDLEERTTELELNAERIDGNNKDIHLLIDYFFIKDYFDGRDSAGCSYPKFNGLIPRNTAERFEKLNCKISGLKRSILNYQLIDPKYYVIEVHYTSGDNAEEHKTTIARYEKEVAEYRKTLKKGE